MHHGVVEGSHPGIILGTRRHLQDVDSVFSTLEVTRSAGVVEAVVPAGICDALVHSTIDENLIRHLDVSLRSDKMCKPLGSGIRLGEGSVLALNLGELIEKVGHVPL